MISAELMLTNLLQEVASELLGVAQDPFYSDERRTLLAIVEAMQHTVMKRLDAADCVPNDAQKYC